MKLLQNIIIMSSLLLACFLSKGCEYNQDQDTETVQLTGTETQSYCDSLYLSYFESESRLKGKEVVKFRDLKELDQLIHFSDSVWGYFIIDFGHDTLIGPALLSGRFFYMDRERRIENPEFGMYFQKNYTFEYSDDYKYVSVQSQLRDDYSIESSDLHDTIKALLFEDFLGDSLALSEVSFIEIKFPKPPTLNDFKHLSVEMKSITDELLEKLCSEFDAEDQSLQYRIRKLAFLGVYVSYDWADTTDFLRENPPPPPPPPSK